MGPDGIRQGWIALNRIGEDWIGFDRVGKDWLGMARIGQDWIGLDKIGLRRIRQDWIGLDGIGKGWYGLEIRQDQVGLDRIGQDWVGLDRIRQDWIGLGSPRLFPLQTGGGWVSKKCIFPHPPKKTLKPCLFSIHFTVSSFLAAMLIQPETGHRILQMILDYHSDPSILSHVFDFSELLLAYACPSGILQRKIDARPINANDGSKMAGCNKSKTHVIRRPKRIFCLDAFNPPGSGPQQRKTCCKANTHLKNI